MPRMNSVPVRDVALPGCLPVRTPASSQDVQWKHRFSKVESLRDRPRHRGLSHDEARVDGRADGRNRGVREAGQVC